MGLGSGAGRGDVFGWPPLDIHSKLLMDFCQFSSPGSNLGYLKNANLELFDFADFRIPRFETLYVN